MFCSLLITAPAILLKKSSLVYEEKQVEAAKQHPNWGDCPRGSADAQQFILLSFPPSCTLSTL